MARKKLRDYHEPWTTSQDTTWETGFRFPPVLSEYRTQDDVNAWHAAKENAKAKAHWTVWAARMSEPRIYEYQGQIKCWEGKGIIGWTRNMPDGVSHEEMATRVCECVNAMRAVADPLALIEDVRSLLLDIIRGQTGPEDPRILKCLARLIPADEIAKLEDSGQTSNREETHHGD
jgi:hypothetical protein